MFTGGSKQKIGVIKVDILINISHKIIASFDRESKWPIRFQETRGVVFD